MCTADTGVHPFILVGNPPLVFPDFNREHKCKNFNDIRAWAEEHQGDFDEETRFHTPLEGELILDEAPWGNTMYVLAVITNDRIYRIQDTYLLTYIFKKDMLSRAVDVAIPNGENKFFYQSVTSSNTYSKSWPLR